MKVVVSHCGCETVIGLVSGSLRPRRFRGEYSWTAENGAAAGIEVVAVDPSAPFATAVRRLLPQATIVVDHWHLVRLANQMVTETRQRVSREQRGRRGRTADPAWAHRRLLLAVRDRLSSSGRRRLAQVLRTDDPTNEISAAWAVKERLRHLLAATTPHDARHRLFRFHRRARRRPARSHPAR